MLSKARDYQSKAVNDVRKEFSNGNKHVLLVSPTGTGKTFMFSMLTKMTIDKLKKVIVFTDRIELLNQAGGSFNKFGIKSFYIKAGVKKAEKVALCFVVMAQTIQRNFKEQWIIDVIKSCDLIVFDEAHKQNFNFLFESGLVDDKYVIGVTATPRRTGKQRQLFLDYDVIVSTIPVKEAISKEYLVPCDFYPVIGVNDDGIRFDAKNGEYNEHDMFNKFNDGKLYKGLIDNYQTICSGTKSLVFCCNTEHVINTTLELSKSGYKVKYLVSPVSNPKIPAIRTDANTAQWEEKKRIYDLYISTFRAFSGDRQEVLDDFTNNNITFLVNNGILTTGYDCPSLETIIVYRLVHSESLWLQILGRGSRPCDDINKTHFNTIYFGSNYRALGTYEQDRIWSLAHSESKNGGTPPVKLCGHNANGRPLNSEGKIGCRRMIHSSAKICPKCGYKYVEKEIKDGVVSGVMIVDDKIVVHKNVSQMSLSELEDFRKLKGYKMPWLWIQLYKRGGDKTIDDYGKEKHWSNAIVSLAKETAGKHLKR